MVHPGGFEPPTARFVAEYSIQLSYGCIGKFILLLILISLLKPYQVRDGASGRIRTSDRSVRSRVLYPAELRMHRETYFTADFLIPPLKPYQVRDGASGRIRTSDRSVRSRVLYPAELRMQMAVRRDSNPGCSFDRIPLAGERLQPLGHSPHASYECFEELVYRSSSLRGAHITF